MNYYFIKSNNDEYYVKANTIKEAKEKLQKYKIEILSCEKNNTLGEGFKFLCNNHSIIINYNDTWQPLKRVLFEGYSI